MAGPRSPNGRGKRLKPAPAWVRIPSGALYWLARSARGGSRSGTRLLRRHSGTEERVPSLLLSTAARDPGLACSLRSRRIALWNPPTSSSLGDGRTRPLASPQHGGARSGVGLLACVGLLANARDVRCLMTANMG